MSFQRFALCATTDDHKSNAGLASCQFSDSIDGQFVALDGHEIPDRQEQGRAVETEPQPGCIAVDGAESNRVYAIAHDVNALRCNTPIDQYLRQGVANTC